MSMHYIVLRRIKVLLPRSVSIRLVLSYQWRTCLANSKVDCLTNIEKISKHRWLPTAPDLFVCLLNHRVKGEGSSTTVNFPMEKRDRSETVEKTLSFQCFSRSSFSFSSIQSDHRQRPRRNWKKLFCDRYRGHVQGIFVLQIDLLI